MAVQTARFDVALSFAGEHRPYVADVASRLRELGYRVFYDDYERADLLGRDLIAYLQDVYSQQSAVVAAFISSEWVTKPWTGHERATALAHALLHAGDQLPFLLPFRFDDTPVPGLQPTVAYDDLRQVRPGERRWRPDPRYKHPRHVTELLDAVLQARGLGTRTSEQESGGGDEGVRSILAWVEDGQPGLAVGLVPLAEFDESATEVFADEVENDGPPAGTYLLLPEELSVAVNPADGLPVFLISTYRAVEKTWIRPLENAADQAEVADYVKRQVQQAVELEIRNGAVPLGPTLTKAMPTPLGPAITGVCVIAQAND